MYFHVTGRQDKEICIQLTTLEEYCTRFCPVCFEGELTEEINYEKWGEKKPQSQNHNKKEIQSTPKQDERLKIQLAKKITPAG